eukprot:5511863-Alexandrium_andersonii.AAC.1
MCIRDRCLVVGARSSSQRRSARPAPAWAVRSTARRRVIAQLGRTAGEHLRLASAKRSTRTAYAKA